MGHPRGRRAQLRARIGVRDVVSPLSDRLSSSVLVAYHRRGPPDRCALLIVSGACQATIAQGQGRTLAAGATKRERTTRYSYRAQRWAYLLRGRYCNSVAKTDSSPANNIDNDIQYQLGGGAGRGPEERGEGRRAGGAGRGARRSPQEPAGARGHGALPLPFATAVNTPINDRQPRR